MGPIITHFDLGIGLNTCPLGYLPYVLDRLPITAGQVDHIGYVGPANDVAKYFNTKLNETVVELIKQLSLASITCVDLYSLKYALLSKAKKYGKNKRQNLCLNPIDLTAKKIKYMIQYSFIILFQV